MRTDEQTGRAPTPRRGPTIWEAIGISVAETVRVGRSTEGMAVEHVR